MEQLPTLRHCPKRSHKKVRTGCTSCKRRKVKCDEKKPECSQCAKQSITCDIIAKNSRRSLVEQKSLNIPTPSSPLPVNLNMLDLELIHHWTLNTYDSLTIDPLLRTFWLRNAVRVGFRCEFVMRSILALSAMHLGYLNPARREELTQHALNHNNLAAAATRASIYQVDQVEDTEMRENLFLYSVIILFYIISQIENPHDTFFGRANLTQQYTPDWMIFFKGCRHLALASESFYISSNLMHPFVNHQLEMGYYYRQKISQGPHLTTLLRQIQNIGDCFTPSEMAAYTHAIQELEAVFGVLAEFPETRDMLHAFFWISNVSDHRGDFIALLQKPNPSQEALVIYAYFCMMTQRLPVRWWADKWVQGLENGALDYLDDEHRTWIVEPPAWGK
ncbi:C6 zinc finger protein [Colletotrichum truncatum]|uniref:C6 zinc finger protein n=1 Tax=Colletotrichum truncatum TaxID=5467 RepID=A0ACC3Z7S8_COLTU